MSAHKLVPHHPSHWTLARMQKPYISTNFTFDELTVAKSEIFKLFLSSLLFYEKVIFTKIAIFPLQMYFWDEYVVLLRQCCPLVGGWDTSVGQV
jgi:hypothetical protein